MANEKLTIDLNELFPPRSSPEAVAQKIQSWDIAHLKGKAVQLKGCSPTWAHLMVAGKIFSIVSSLDFLMDNAKGGVPIPIFKSS